MSRTPRNVPRNRYFACLLLIMRSSPLRFCETACTLCTGLVEPPEELEEVQTHCVDVRRERADDEVEHLERYRDHQAEDGVAHRCGDLVDRLGEDGAGKTDGHDSQVARDVGECEDGLDAAADAIRP